MRLNVREILRISAIKQVYMIVFNYNVKMEVLMEQARKDNRRIGI